MNRKALMASIAFFIAILLLASGFFYVNYKLGLKQDIKRPLYLTVQAGDSLQKVIATLESRGVINSPTLLGAYFNYQGWETKIKAGDYVFSSPISMIEVAQRLIAGDAKSKETSLTIPEGYNINDINNELISRNLTSGQEWVSIVGIPRTDYRNIDRSNWPKDYTGQFSFLADKPVFVGLEGYLFPDTYRLYKDSTPQDIAEKMLSNFDRKLTSTMREEIKRQGKTIFEVITMASVIEKEVRNTTDMKVVSGIFWKRIKNKQRLESCATLAYILGVNKSQYTLDDTKIDSPYNTYQNSGLPPTPIANPGLNAIEAAIYPIETDYNFFLTASGTGQTIFSRTFAEHLKNKDIHLK